MAVYLDCAATAPLDPRVQREVMTYLGVEFGNAGSRHHGFGTRARSAVEKARVQVAAVVGATRGEIVFTSGATESNNLALLGLAEHGARTGRTHLVSTRIEHKSVLEPLQALAGRGFEITLVSPEPGGWVHPQSILEAVREDTLLVSVMQVNNETGVIQPVREIARLLEKPSRLSACGCRPGFREGNRTATGPSHRPDQHQRSQDLCPQGHRGPGHPPA